MELNISCVKYSIKKIAAAGLGGKIIGDPAAAARFVSDLACADLESLVFSNSTNPAAVANINAGIVLASDALEPEPEEFSANAIVLVPSPMSAFIRVVNDNYDDSFKPAGGDIADSAGIADSAHIEEGVSISEESSIFPLAAIHAGTRIGRNCRIQSSATIGAIGLAYSQTGDAYEPRFTHLGGVEIGDGVDIGANTTVARGILEDTVIGDGTKIGNNANIGHNVTIGKNCFISSGAVLCGSAVLEDGCWVAPNATILNKITVRAGTQVGIGAVITKDTEPDSVYFGNPAKRIGARRR